MKKFFTLLLALFVLPLAAEEPSIPYGDWSGTISFGVVKYTLVLHVVKQENGKPLATMDVIEKNAKDVSLDTFIVKNNWVDFSTPSPKTSFRGYWYHDKNCIVGKFKKGIISVSLNLKNIGGPKTVETSFENEKGEARLSGTLTLPSGSQPFPAVVLISGAGPSDRDTRSNLALTDHLSSLGIASLRYDKRGIGKSTGSFERATSADFANDAISAVEYLKNHPEIDSSQIGLIGHSEGGAIAASVAALTSDIAYLVSLGAPAVPGEELLYGQESLIQEVHKAHPKRMEIRKKVFSIIRDEEDFHKRAALVKKEVEAYFANAPLENSHVGEDVLRPDTVDYILPKLLSPWFRYFLTYDSTHHLKQVKSPILALGAEKDFQVPSKQSLSAIRKALEEASHRDFTVQELPDHNHMFQTCTTGTLFEYDKIEEPLSPVVLNTISDWISAKTASKK